MAFTLSDGLHAEPTTAIVFTLANGKVSSLQDAQRETIWICTAHGKVMVKYGELPANRLLYLTYYNPILSCLLHRFIYFHPGKKRTPDLSEPMRPEILPTMIGVSGAGLLLFLLSRSCQTHNDQMKSQSVWFKKWGARSSEGSPWCTSRSWFPKKKNT